MSSGKKWGTGYDRLSQTAYGSLVIGCPLWVDEQSSNRNKYGVLICNRIKGFAMSAHCVVWGVCPSIEMGNAVISRSIISRVSTYVLGSGRDPSGPSDL